MKIKRSHLRSIIQEVFLSEFREIGDAPGGGSFGGSWEASVPSPVIQKASLYRMDGSEGEVSLEANRDLVINLLRAFYVLEGRGDLYQGLETVARASVREYMGKDSIGANIDGENIDGLPPQTYQLEWGGKTRESHPHLFRLASFVDEFVKLSKAYYRDLEEKLAAMGEEPYDVTEWHWGSKTNPMLADLDKALIYYGNYVG